jgi:hypothetical protein
MILKEREDSSNDIEVLEGLLTHPAVDSTKRRKIEEQIRNIVAGNGGEADAAYEMKVHFGPTKNWIVIHDLRIEHDGLVAQIDHLIINRMLEIWLLESKRFSNGIKINEQGEFATFFNRIPKGMASPIEQNGRHRKILQRVFDEGLVKLPTRLGITLKPAFKSLVLISRGAIQRPANGFPGLETVIKNDQLASTIFKSSESANLFDIAKIVGTDTLEKIGRQIIELHRPIRFDWQTRFGLNDTATEQPRPLASSVESIVAPTQVAVTLALPATPQPAPIKAVKTGATCCVCATVLSRGVAKFCSENTARFDGQMYCMPCQAKISEAPASV